jgi:hypothetical protein
MNETELYKKIHESLIRVCGQLGIHKDRIHFVRIESPSSPGLPDINCKVILHDDFWIECKITPNTSSPLQKSWKKQRELAGGWIFVIAYNNERQTYYFEDKTELFYDINLDTITADILDKTEMSV